MQFIYLKCDKIFSKVYWSFHINKKHGKFHEATEKVWHIGFKEKGKTREKGEQREMHTIVPLNMFMA
jgi:hypothetical protein